MGCGFSQRDDDVVSLCKERKDFIKQAIKRRKDLADAHTSYIRSFPTVAAAIRLFVARHSSPSSPFLITFHPPELASQTKENNQVLPQPEPMSQPTQPDIAPEPVPVPQQAQPVPVPMPQQAQPVPVPVSVSMPMPQQAQPVPVPVSVRMPMPMPQQAQPVPVPVPVSVRMPMPQQAQPVPVPVPVPMPQQSQPVPVPVRMPKPQQAQTRPTLEDLTGMTTPSSLSSSSSEGESDDESPICPYFYTETSSEMPSARGENNWNFFNQHAGVKSQVLGGTNQGPINKFNILRKKTEIQKLVTEEKAETGVSANNAGKEIGVEITDNPTKSEEQKGLTVVATPAEGRDLLFALKDVEEQFIKSYKSVKDVTLKLEPDSAHLQSGLEGAQVNSIKLHQIKWYRSPFSFSPSTLSRSSSSKSILSSGSQESFMRAESKKDTPNNHGGSELEKHLQTLERLYAWEDKLYREVKVGESSQKIYKRKCSKLEDQNVNEDGSLTVVKATPSVTNPYNRMLVSIRTAEVASEKIHNLRDGEFLLQLIELLQGLMNAWKIIYDAHETQKQIMSEVKSFNCPSYGKFCNESHRLATLQLDTELQNWCACFTRFVAAQRAYAEALNGWLSRFFVPEVEFYSKTKALVPPHLTNGPPVLMICHDWVTSLKILPDKEVKKFMKTFRKDVWSLWVQQGKEHQQKRKAEYLAKELDKSVLAAQRAENKILEHKASGKDTEPDSQHLAESLAQRTELVNKLRKKLDAERAKHHKFMEETQRITLDGFQTGMTSVFKSLTEFSKDSLKMYNELALYSEKVKLGGNAIESSQS